MGDVVVAAYVLDLYWLIQKQESANPDRPCESPGRYWTAMVAVLDTALPTLSCTGTASPAGELCGTCTFTW